MLGAAHRISLCGPFAFKAYCVLHRVMQKAVFIEGSATHAVEEINRLLVEDYKDWRVDSIILARGTISTYAGAIVVFEKKPVKLKAGPR